MIAYLQGTVLEPGVVLTSDGVGYAVRTVDEFQEGQDVSLRVTTTVRDNDISLWGFTDRSQQTVFSSLTSVPNVGPTLAMTMLQTLGVAGIASAVSADDPKALAKSPGVGPTLAKRILAAIKLPEGLSAAAGPTGPSERVLSTVRTSLANLGYGPEAVDEALEQVTADPDVTASELASEVLKVLSLGGAA